MSSINRCTINIKKFIIKNYDDILHSAAFTHAYNGMSNEEKLLLTESKKHKSKYSISQDEIEWLNQMAINHSNCINK